MMTTTGPLRLGAAQILSRTSAELIGYAFATAHGGGQMQRWILYRNPQNSFDIQPAPAHMQSWVLSDWQANVASLWRAGSFYVWAQADVYRHDESHGGTTWTQIPSADHLPPPSYPDIPGSDFQLDYAVLNGCNVIQGQYRGLAYSIGSLSDSSSAEYWMLPAGYEPAGGSGSASVAPGTDSIGSLQEFVAVANRNWGPGCSFVITGCVNYCGEHAPSMP